MKEAAEAKRKEKEKEWQQSPHYSRRMRRERLYRDYDPNAPMGGYSYDEWSKVWYYHS